MRHITHEALASLYPCRDQFKRFKQMFPKSRYPYGMPVTIRNITLLAAETDTNNSDHNLHVWFLHLLLPDNMTNAFSEMTLSGAFPGSYNTARQRAHRSSDPGQVYEDFGLFLAELTAALQAEDLS
jgi:hypothetical protein